MVPVKEKDILLDDPDIGPQGVLGEGAHVLSVHQHPAPGDIVEPGDELAQGGLAAAGGPTTATVSPGRTWRVTCSSTGGSEGSYRKVTSSTRMSPFTSVSSWASGSSWMSGSTRIRATNRLKPAMPCINCSTKAESLRMGGDEGGDVEEERGQVDEIHPPPHEQESAEGDDYHGQDAHEELHPRLIEGHGPVVAPLGPPELVVGLVEFGALRRLVGEGLGGTHAGDGGLNLPVNARQLGLHLSGGSHHPLAAQGGEQDEQGDYRKYDQGQLPPDGEHDAEGPPGW